MKDQTLTPPREAIVDYLASIVTYDPDGLGGVRTSMEIAERLNLTKDGARHHLEKLRDDALIECVGPMAGEIGRPVGWKSAP